MEKIDIVIVTYNRVELLKRTIEGVVLRTHTTPYRIIVFDNNSTKDSTKEYLKYIEEAGYVDLVIHSPNNVGLALGYTRSFEFVKSEYFITANDDLVPPYYKDEDWLAKLIKVFDEYYPEYGALALRCPRLKNVYCGSDWLPHPNKICEARSALSAIFRIQKRSDMLKAPSCFGTLIGYNDEIQFKKIMKTMGFRTGFIADMWANHIGFALENRGYPEGFNGYLGRNEAGNKKCIQQGYPPIDPLTNKPLCARF